MVYCAVKGCNNNNNRKSKNYNCNCRYFTFPTDKRISDMWVQKTWQKYSFNVKTARICSDHFVKSDYCIKEQLLELPFSQWKLKADAVPSAKLPESTCSSNTERGERIKIRGVKNSMIESSILKENIRILRETAMFGTEDKSHPNETPQETELLPLITVKKEQEDPEEIFAQNIVVVQQEPIVKTEDKIFDEIQVKEEIFEESEPEPMAVTTDSETSDNDLESFDCPSPEFINTFNNNNNNLTENHQIPLRSVRAYENCFKKFLKWCKLNDHKEYTEDVFLTYFSGLKVKSSSMWAQYSMIKLMLIRRNGLDISKFSNLREYLKKQNEGYVPNKTRVFTKEQFEKFLNEAPDEKYLGMKIVLVIGVCGACRCDELVKMEINHIEDLGSLLYIQIPESATNEARTFTIAQENFINIYRKFASLRPKCTAEPRFFLKYTNGRCQGTAIGKNKIGSVAKEVASYLNLPHSEEYTWHCLRRASATLLKKFGEADITYFKRLRKSISLTEEDPISTEQLPQPQSSSDELNLQNSAASSQTEDEECFDSSLENNLKIRKLQEEINKMKRNVNSYKLFLKEMREKDLITDAAEEVLMKQLLKIID